ncbi:MAG: sensor domain-containing diguanylate cyclase, partial [Solirubrobacterales bacterium]
VLIALTIGLFTALSQETLLNVVALFNCFRVAFTGNRRILAFTLVATVIAFAIPGLLYPDELGGRAIIWIIVLLAVTFPIQAQFAALHARADLNARLAREFSDLLSSEDPRTSIVRAARNLGSADIAIIYEVEPGGRLTIAACSGADDGDLEIPAGQPSMASLSVTNRAIAFAPYLETVECELPPGMKQVDPASLICCPITRDGEVVATLCAGWKERVLRSSDPNVTVIKILATEAAATIDQSELVHTLEDRAASDPLTGLPNRRAWEGLFRKSLTDSQRLGKPVSIAILDLDHFKAFNDTHGHQAGDRMLLESATAWKEALRQNDLIFRWGGEEFTVILPNCDRDQAVEVIERLRIATPGSETSSAGVSTWDGEESADDLFDRTDRALYSAKESGRNRTVAA